MDPILAISLFVVLISLPYALSAPFISYSEIKAAKKAHRTHQRMVEEQVREFEAARARL